MLAVPKQSLHVCKCEETYLFFHSVHPLPAACSQSVAIIRLHEALGFFDQASEGRRCVWTEALDSVLIKHREEDDVFGQRP